MSQKRVSSIFSCERVKCERVKCEWVKCERVKCERAKCERANNSVWCERKTLWKLARELDFKVGGCSLLIPKSMCLLLVFVIVCLAFRECRIKLEFSTRIPQMPQTILVGSKLRKMPTHGGRPDLIWSDHQDVRFFAQNLIVNSRL